MRNVLKICKNEFTDELNEYKEIIDSKLSELITIQNVKYDRLIESMLYSLLSGGKRIRAIICIKFCEAVGGSIEDALYAACAIEMLHAYSLIHDDLPCMDNSNLRRGKPSNHIQYDEFTATLAGDALQAFTFETILASKLPSSSIAEIAKILAAAAGVNGICGGQYLDICNEEKLLSIAELIEIHTLKTAALISAAARIGVICGNGSPEQVEFADKYAKAIGLAFQVRDDMLDILSTEEKLGKPVGSDSDNKKTTFTTLLSIEECDEMIRFETSKAINAIEKKFENTDFLINFANYLAVRDH